MTRIISRESVRQANNSLSKTTSRIGMDSTKIVLRVDTSFGSKEFVVSKQALNDAAKTAMKNMRNG